MPRSNAAEAWPAHEEPKDEDIEELPQDILKEGPPPIPKSDTEKALEMVKELNETREADERKREAEEAAAAAAAERKKIIEARDKAATVRARRAMGAAPLEDLTHELNPTEPPPIPSADKGWSERPGAIPDNREIMPSTPPPIPKDAKKPSLMKRIGRWFRG